MRRDEFFAIAASSKPPAANSTHTHWGTWTLEPRHLRRPLLHGTGIRPGMVAEIVDVAVVGAGAAGLTAARSLSAHGLRVVVLEAGSKVRHCAR